MKYSRVQIFEYRYYSYSNFLRYSYSGMGKIECNRYSLLFYHRKYQRLYFFGWQSNMPFSLLFSSEIDFLYFSSCNLSKFVILIVLVQISCSLRSNCITNNNQTQRYGFNDKWKYKCLMINKLRSFMAKSPMFVEQVFLNLVTRYALPATQSVWSIFVTKHLA